jgi:hypothetical protein
MREGGREKERVEGVEGRYFERSIEGDGGEGREGECGG